MPKFRNFQTNFSGGLLSEGMLGRLDLAQYENGCRQLDNWWPKVTGGMRRRPGSLFLDTNNASIRIEGFVFNEVQTYLFSFDVSPDQITIYDEETGAIIDTVTITGTPATFWSEQVVKKLSITQTADVMFLAHELFLPIMIRRLDATNFQQEEYEFEGFNIAGDYPKAMPFVKFVALKNTIEVNGLDEGDVVTITSNEQIFEARHVNRAIRYRGKQIFITSVAAPPSFTAVGTILEDLDPGAVLQFGATDAASDFEIDEIIVGRDSGVKGQVISKTTNEITIGMIGGTFPALSTEEVEGLISGNIATITANSNVNPVPSSDWDEEAFSDENGYPSVIEFHSQRLWLAGSSSLPAHIFGSRVAAFFNFDVGDAFPADSIQVVISDKQVNMINDIVSGRHLQVFTDAGEFYAPQTEDTPLIPETFNLIKQTRYGSNNLIEPKLFDESTIFLQAEGNAVREFIWIDQLRGYSSDAISLIAEEFIQDVQEVEVLYGGYDRPEQIAFFVNGDGSITWYHAARAEQIRTWGIWQTQGDYKSLTVIADKMYALVDRPTGIFIERFELDVTLDSAVQASDVSKSVWVGDAPHLTDELIQVGTSVIQANNDPDYFLGEFTYAADTIDLGSITVDNITIGYGFVQTLEIMPIEIKDSNGVTGGMPKRIVSADVYIASTAAIQIEGHRITTFIAGSDLSVKPDLITGVRKFYLFGYDERPTLTIVNDIPVPCEALSLGAEVEY
jgi:hypothetical protein